MRLCWWCTFRSPMASLARPPATWTGTGSWPPSSAESIPRSPGPRRPRRSPTPPAPRAQLRWSSGTTGLAWESSPTVRCPPGCAASSPRRPSRRYARPNRAPGRGRGEAGFPGRLRVPAPSLLVAVGLAVGLLPGAPTVHVPPAVVSLVVLPPLLYAASEELAWRDLRAVWRPVAVLAVGLVLASAAAVAAVAGAVASLSASMAFVLGAVLASTDPVAVSALGRRLSLPPRVQALVQGESLFNDGTSLVLFQIAVSLAVGGTAVAATGTLLHGAGEFVIAAGGIVVRRRITDPVLETVTALLTPYVAYLLGEQLHVSGVTAVIVAGLVIGAQRSKITTAQTRLQLHSVY